MLLNGLENKAVTYSKQGDHPGFSVIDIESKRIKPVKTNNCEYLSLKQMSSHLFITVEHFKGKKLLFSIRSYEAPYDVLSSTTIEASNIFLTGDIDLWKEAPRYHVEYFMHPILGNNFYLIDFKAASFNDLFIPLDWFDDTYDKQYQRVMDVIKVPGENFLLFSVQRSSDLVLYDMQKKSLIKKIPLAGRRGNPQCIFNNDGNELWCIDYDTLLKLKTLDFQILLSKQLQEPSDDMTMQFIGGFALTKNGRYCAVARPFSNDLILLDATSFKTVSISKSNFQPVEVLILSDFKFISRDWKTGEVEFGRFEQ